ncbi:MAG: OmpP1/FadL family transporter [Desulfobulbaceae bacterium]
MRKTILLCAAAALVAGSASTALASGYRIPEQSLNATALSNAYLAGADRADAAYYNPANMAWLGEGTLVEGGLTYIHLPSIDYTDARTSAYNGESESENFLVPNLHLVSPDLNNFRFGFSLVFPAGLSKRWDDVFPRTFAREFSMTVVEANPTVSYRFNDMFSVAGGVRFIYSEATVKSNGTIIAVPPTAANPNPEYVTISRDMDGDTFEYGYNLAASLRPVENLAVGATYRSKVDMDLEGNGTLTASQSFMSGMIPAGSYVGPGSVSVPLPAVFALGVAYTFEKATIEFEYDRTFWSDYETLDFSYPRSLGHPVLISAFDDPIAKDWDDVDAFRIGLTYQMDQNLALMAGFGLDGNPIPDSSLSFDLPDSDAWFISFGARYDLDERLSFGAA